MNKIKIEINKKIIKRKTPENWNELSLKQLLFVVPRVMFINKSLRIKREIFYYFLNVKDKFLVEMNKSQEDDLLKSVDFLFKAPTLTKNPIPELMIDGITFQGLEDGLNNICASQFAFADKFLNKFLKTKKENFLNFLLATLYVEEGKKFKKENIENNSKYIKSLSLNKRLTILAYFIGCRNKISENNKDIFKKEKQSRKQKTGWLGLFYELAGPKMGTYEDVANKNFLELLSIMRKINIDARDAEKKIKRKR